MGAMVRVLMLIMLCMPFVMLSTRVRPRNGHRRHSTALKCCCPAKVQPEPKWTVCMKLQQATGGAKQIAKAALSGVKTAMTSGAQGGAVTALKKLGKNQVEIDGATYTPVNGMAYAAAKKIGKGCSDDEYMMKLSGLVGECKATEKKKHSNPLIGEYEKNHCPEGFSSSEKTSFKARYGT